MKKTIILLVISIMAFCCPVQAQHLKFMGIPLNGTITQFQQKLTAKGVKYDKASSQVLPSGIRAYKGSFVGHDANIYVYYDLSSKIVYEAKAVLGFTSESSCDIEYNEIKTLLSTKYPDAETDTDYQDGHEAYYYRVLDNEYNPLGVISVFVSTNIYAYPYEHQVHIEYTDYTNYLKNEDSRMNDL